MFGWNIVKFQPQPFRETRQAFGFYGDQPFIINYVIREKPTHGFIVVKYIIGGHSFQIVCEISVKKFRQRSAHLLPVDEYPPIGRLDARNRIPINQQQTIHKSIARKFLRNRIRIVVQQPPATKMDFIINAKTVIQPEQNRLHRG